MRSTANQEDLRKYGWRRALQDLDAMVRLSELERPIPEQVGYTEAMTVARNAIAYAESARIEDIRVEGTPAIPDGYIAVVRVNRDGSKQMIGVRLADGGMWPVTGAPVIQPIKHGDPTEAEPPLDATPAEPMGERG